MFKLNGILFIETYFTGDGEHKCSVCAKFFNRATLLKIHMKSHSLERPFVCHLCGKAFKYGNNLKVHSKRHIGKEPIVCNVCGHIFLKMTALKQHMTEVHPEC